MKLCLCVAFVLTSSTYAMRDRAIDFADRTTNLAWLATPPVDALTSSLVNDAAPGLARCMAGVLRMSKMLETVHGSGKAKDLDDAKLKTIAAEASKESSPRSGGGDNSGGCGDSCKLEMYKDATHQRMELWETIGRIAGSAGSSLTAASHSMDFFKTGKVTASPRVRVCTPHCRCCFRTL